MTAGDCADGGVAGAAVAAALQFFAAAQCLVGEPWPPQASVCNESCFDFIVVGGGTGGSALAARLAEIGNGTVLLLEAGGDPPPESIIPGFRHALKGSKYDWNFTTVDDKVTSQALSGGSQRQPRGRMLGGSGSMNDMVYARGFPADYAEWAELGGRRWDWPSALHYFKKTEHLTDERILGDPELAARHGRGGAIEVAGRRESSSDIDMFLAGFEELGFETVTDMTSPDGIGAGRFSHTVRAGRRDSSATALLNEAATRDNLFVLKDALVTEILTSDRVAYGVRALVGGEARVFYARAEVVVCAGTFNTPKLLMLSGIGPGEHLRALGVAPVHELPVGDNLHDHVMVLQYLAAENGTCYADSAAGYMDTIRYLYDRSGPLGVPNSMGAYLALDGSSQPNVPDFALYPTCMPIDSDFRSGCEELLGFRDSICSELETLNKEYELISIAVVLLKPKSRGSVRLKSADALDPPIILSGTFSDPEDLEGFPEAIRKAHSLAETTYFKSKKARVVEFKIEECKGLEGPAGVKCQARAMAMSAWHAVGTCALGAVVDEELRVLGVAGLRVADASVMPTVVRGNTNAPVVMIAEQAADLIKAEHEGRLSLNPAAAAYCFPS